VKVGVIGLGHVGSPLVVEFAEAGADVIGVEVDARKIAAANATQLS
jgi:UDP-N-acetyl-D-glucosamine dehydrogenase